MGDFLDTVLLIPRFFGAIFRMFGYWVYDSIYKERCVRCNGKIDYRRRAVDGWCLECLTSHWYFD